MRISKESKSRNKFSKQKVNKHCNRIDWKVEKIINWPIVQHPKPIDFHILDKPLFFFQNNRIQKHRETQRQQDRIDQNSDAIYNFFSFISNPWLKWHKLLSGNNMSVWKYRPDVSLVYPVCELESTLRRPHYIWSISRVFQILKTFGSILLLCHEANFSYAVVPMILEVRIVIYL